MSDDEDIDQSIMFTSALGVGSNFIKCTPDDNLDFTRSNENGLLISNVILENITKNAMVAYYVYTTNKSHYKIEPDRGFFPPKSKLVVSITSNEKDQKALESDIFFVKALPLSENWWNDPKQHAKNPHIFNKYNIGILFVTAALPVDIKFSKESADRILSNKAGLQITQGEEETKREKISTSFQKPLKHNEEDDITDEGIGNKKSIYESKNTLDLKKSPSERMKMGIVEKNPAFETVSGGIVRKATKGGFNQLVDEQLDIEVQDIK